MRVGIVNDLTLAVEVLRRAVLSEPGYEVAWTALNGQEACERCATDPPDLVLMDLIMPGMDGVEATKRIMKSNPCPILVVTATVDGNSAKVFDAMSFGALDAVNTPVFGANGDISGASDLVTKMRMIARLSGRKSAAPVARVEPSHGLPPIVAIGASTGGPGIVSIILGRLATLSPATAVLIQHVDRQFAAGLVDWLQKSTSHPVALVAEGDALKPGYLHIAATNDHLVLQPGGVFHYTPHPLDNYYRPSVDVFFHSLATAGVGPGMAILLTGMGSDGARGLLELRTRGWHTVAQEKDSCIVYGMPRAASEINAAEAILEPDEIAADIERWVISASVHP